MAMSLMNGLSAMGASIAETAGAAALEQQKASLAQQSAALAASLAHGYRTQEIGQQGSIASALATQQGGIQSGIIAQQVAGEEATATIGGTARIRAANAYAGGEMGAAGINAAASEANMNAQIAARAPLLAAQEKGAIAQAGLAGTEADSAAKVFAYNRQLSTLQGLPATPENIALMQTIEAKRNMLIYDPKVAAVTAGVSAKLAQSTTQLVNNENVAISKTESLLAGVVAGGPAERAALQQQLVNQRAERDANLVLLKSYIQLGADTLGIHGAPAGVSPPAPGGGPSYNVANPKYLPITGTGSPAASPSVPGGPAAGSRPSLLNGTGVP